MTGGGVCVACGAAVTSVGMALCAAAVVDVVMTIAAIGIAIRLKADSTLREQITRTLPFN